MTSRNAEAGMRSVGPGTWQKACELVRSVPRKTGRPTIPSWPIVAVSTAVPSAMTPTIEPIIPSGK